MNYLTRHLVALRDLPIGDRLVPVGGSFYATDVDANYLKGNRHARDAVPDEHATSTAVDFIPATMPAAAPAAPAAPAQPAAAALADQVPADGAAGDVAEPGAGQAAAEHPTADAPAGASPASEAAAVKDEHPAAAPSDATSQPDNKPATPASRRRAGRPSNAEVEARQAAAKGGDDQAGASGS